MKLRDAEKRCDMGVIPPPYRGHEIDTRKEPGQRPHWVSEVKALCWRSEAMLSYRAARIAAERHIDEALKGGLD